MIRMMREQRMIAPYNFELYTNDNQKHVSNSKGKSKKRKSNGGGNLKKYSLEYREFRNKNNISVCKTHQKTMEKQKELRQLVQALQEEISESKQEKQTNVEELYSLEEQDFEFDWDIHYLKIKGLAEPDNCDQCQIRSLQGFS